MGFEARVAVAFSAGVFSVEEEDGLASSLRRSAAMEQSTFRPVPSAVLRNIAAAFAGRMAAIGAPLESSRLTEEQGAIAIALEPAPALEAGDQAMRAKTYLTGIPHMEPSQPAECGSKPLDVQFAFE